MKTSDRIAVISVREPWLDAIRFLGKRRENRRRRTDYRGEVYLHRPGSCTPEEYERAVAFMAERVGIPRASIPPRREAVTAIGHLVARATLVDCVPPGPSPVPWAFEDQHGLILENVVDLPAPIPFAGKPSCPFFVPAPGPLSPRGEALRVVMGAGRAGVVAYRNALARGGRVFTVAPPGDALAIEAGARNMTGPEIASMVLYADEVIDVTGPEVRAA